MTRFRKILCPVDFSTPSQAALDWAEELAAKFGAELVVLHVVSPLIAPVAYGFPASVIVDYEAIAEETARKALVNLVGAIRKRGGNARALVATGMAAQRICELAAEERADLVVLSTHGLTGIQHVLFGSTAERVVRTCACPVLTVRASGPEVRVTPAASGNRAGATSKRESAKHAL